MLDLSSLQYNTEHPTLISILFTVLCSLLLGTMIAFTYERTSKNTVQQKHFLQAMVLITIVAAMIMQAIGDSVARGLGMLGALSIIRFRTSVKDPRNIVFMFGAIAAGIACGVFGFVIAVVGTLGFCGTAFLLRYSTFGIQNRLIGRLQFETLGSQAHAQEVKTFLSQYCKYHKRSSEKYFTDPKKAERVRIEYEFLLTKGVKAHTLFTHLQEIDHINISVYDFRRDSLFKI